jgi:hypothetical protein
VLKHHRILVGILIVLATALYWSFKAGNKFALSMLAAVQTGFVTLFVEELFNLLAVLSEDVFATGGLFNSRTEQ